MESLDNKFYNKVDFLPDFRYNSVFFFRKWNSHFFSNFAKKQWSLYNITLALCKKIIRICSIIRFLWAFELLLLLNLNGNVQFLFPINRFIGQLYHLQKLRYCHNTAIFNKSLHARGLTPTTYDDTKSENKLYRQPLALLEYM